MSRRLIPRPARIEEEVLLCCAQYPPSPDLCKSVSKVSDWNRLLGVSEAQGMAPVLWRILLDQPGEVLPSPLRIQVGEQFRQNLRRNLALTARLVKLLVRLAATGIRAVPFKGPVLAERGYGDPGLRRYLDLDLLVRREDALAAREFMLANGFRPERELTPAWLDAHLRSQCDFKFFGEQGGEAVEVHWDLTPRYLAFDADISGMLTRTEPLTLAGTEIRVLSPEDVVTALCVHGMKHLWERLGWIHDLARWIHVHPDIVWSRVFGRAETRGLARVLVIGLLLCAELSPESLPLSVRRRLTADHIAVGLARQLGGLLFSSPPSTVRAMRIHMSSREHSRDALHYLTRLAFTTTHRDWTTLPSSGRMFALRGLWRPVRLFRDAVNGGAT